MAGQGWNFKRIFEIAPLHYCESFYIMLLWKNSLEKVETDWKKNKEPFSNLIKAVESLQKDGFEGYDGGALLRLAFVQYKRPHEKIQDITDAMNGIYQWLCDEIVLAKTRKLDFKRIENYLKEWGWPPVDPPPYIKKRLDF